MLWRPGFWLLVALSVAAAILCFSNVSPAWRAIAGDRGDRVCPVADPQPLEPVIESLRVKPDELRIEKPYLASNIAMTRHAYKLDAIDVMPFAGKGR